MPVDYVVEQIDADQVCWACFAAEPNVHFVPHVREVVGRAIGTATQPNDGDAERPERSIAERLVDQARADGVDLVGPGGLLTKQVLETGLESRWKNTSAMRNTPQ